MRSLPLRREPSVRQIETILRRIEEELTVRGAVIDRTAPMGGLRFRMPRPWKAPRLGLLLFITSGRAVVSAGSGGPWKVRYKLDFSVLLGLVLVLSVGLIVVGLSWPDRTSLLIALLILWFIVYGVPYSLATTRFRQIIQKSTQDVIERRRAPRPPSDQPAGTEPPPDVKPPTTGVDLGPGE